MEPRQEPERKSPQPRNEEKKKRFRLVRLEERIAPAAGGKNVVGSWVCLPASQFTDC
jgi:hypothetical protein